MFLFSFPTFYDFLMSSFISSCSSFWCSLWLSLLSQNFKIIVLDYLSDLLSNCDFSLSYRFLLLLFYLKDLSIFPLRQAQYCCILFFSFFCLSENSFSPSILNNNLAEQSILDYRFFLFQYFQCILPCPSGLQYFKFLIGG